MKVVLQRVSAASVTIQNQKVANIQKGLLVFVGISEEDAQEDINSLVRKILHLRIFRD
jgi:D-tyrosyl-tRNA(Tyr) deacylase